MEEKGSKPDKKGIQIKQVKPSHRASEFTHPFGEGYRRGTLQRAPAKTDLSGKCVHDEEKVFLPHHDMGGHQGPPLKKFSHPDPLPDGRGKLGWVPGA